MIRVTQEMLLANQPIAPGWHKVSLVEWSQAASKAGDSINYFPVFQTEDGRKTSQFASMFNSKAEGRMVPFAEAILGRELAVGDELDPEKWIGKQLFVEIEISIYNGNEQRRVRNFASIQNPPL